MSFQGSIDEELNRTQQSRVDIAIGNFQDYAELQQPDPEPETIPILKKEYSELVLSKLDSEDEKNEFMQKFFAEEQQVEAQPIVEPQTVDDELESGGFLSAVGGFASDTIDKAKDSAARVGVGATRFVTTAARQIGLSSLEDDRDSVKGGSLFNIPNAGANLPGIGFLSNVSNSFIENQITRRMVNNEVETTGEKFEVAKTRLLDEKLQTIETDLRNKNLPLKSIIDGVEGAAFKLFSTNKRFDQDFTAKIAEAVGSLVPGLLVGLVTKNPLAIGAAVSGVGSASNSYNQFAEAIADGADLDSALEASDFGKVVGLADGLPLGRTLKIFQGGDTRFATKLLEKTAFLKDSTAGTIGASAITGAFEEALQEFTAEVANNAIQINATGLEEDQAFFDALFAGTGESAEIGGAVGAILNTFVASLGVRRGAKRASGDIRTDAELIVERGLEQRESADSELVSDRVDATEAIDVDAEVTADEELTVQDVNEAATILNTPEFGEGQPLPSEEIPLQDKVNSFASNNGTGTPGTGTPGTGTPGAGTPGAGTPGTGTPGAGVAPTPLNKRQKVGRTFRKWLHPSSLFSNIDGGFELLELRRSILGAEHAVEIDAVTTSAKFAQSVFEESGIKYADLTKAERNDMYQIMTTGKTTGFSAGSRINPVNIDTATKLSRNKVDQHSDNIIKAFDSAISFATNSGVNSSRVVKNLLIAKNVVEQNKGSYMNRSFQVFENKRLLNNFEGSDLHIKAINEANDALFKGNNIAQATQVVNEFVADVREADSNVGFLVGSINRVYSGNIKFQSIFKNKNDQLDQWVKTILHEDTDPISVLNKTLAKQGKFFENLNAETAFLDFALQTGLASTTAKTGFVKAENSASSGRRFSFFADMYLLKDVKDSLDAFYGGGSPDAGVQILNMVNLIQKVDATILSTGAQVRNNKGAFTAAVLNGAVTPSNIVNTLRQFRQFSKDKKANEFSKYKEFLVRGRIISDSAHADPIADLAGTVSDTQIAQIFGKGFNTKLLSNTYNGGKQVFQAWSKAYRISDEFFKVVNFNKELKFHVEKMGMSELDAMNRAAEITRLVMPTASNTQALVNRLRAPKSTIEAAAALGFSSFLTFNAEIARNTANIVILSKQEIQSGNPVLVRHGIERISTLIATAAFLVHKALPEDDELNPTAVDRILPWYYQGKEMGGGRIDPNGDIRFNVTHYSNPMAPFTNSIRLFGEYVFTDNIDNEELLKSVYGSTLGEFLGENMTIQNIELLFTADGIKKKYPEQWQRVAQNMSPKVMTDAWKINENLRSIQTPAQAKELDNRLLKLVDSGDFILTKPGAAGFAGNYLRVYKSDFDKFINETLLSTEADFDPEVSAVKYVNEATKYLDKSKSTVAQLVEYQSFLESNGITYTDAEIYKNFKGASGMTKGMYMAIAEAVREDTLDEITPFTTFKSGSRKSRLIDAGVIERRAKSGKVNDPDHIPVFEERSRMIEEEIALMQLNRG